MDNHEAADRMMVIKEEIIDLLHEAMTIAQQHGSSTTVARARSYWYGHIRTALDEDSGYMGRSMCTLEDTAREIQTDAENEEEESQEGGI